MSDAAQTQTKPAQSKNPLLEVNQTKFTVGLGSKGDRKTWTATVTGDYQDFPANIRTFLMEAGFRYMMSQAASAADRESAKRKEAKPGERGDWVGNPGTAYTPAEHEARALALATERVEMFKRGETGKQVTVLNATDRRAFDNLVNAIRARLESQNQKATVEQIAEKARQILASPAGQKFKDEARKQIEAEQAKVNQLAASLGDFDI